MVRKEDTAAFKSKKFALRIVNMCRYVSEKDREYVMTNQLLRSGTSIGANLAEAESSITKKDFLNKVYTALKESKESKYWIDLLFESQLLTEREYQSIHADCVELIKMLTATKKTTRNSLNSKH